MTYTILNVKGIGKIGPPKVRTVQAVPKPSEREWAIAIRLRK